MTLRSPNFPKKGALVLYLPLIRCQKPKNKENLSDFARSYLIQGDFLCDFKFNLVFISENQRDCLLTDKSGMIYMETCQITTRVF